MSSGTTTNRLHTLDLDARVSMRGTSSAVDGPVNWFQLHNFAFNFPLFPTASDRERAAQYVRGALPFLMSCMVCKVHALALLKQHPPDFSNRDTLSRWTVWFHNVVNDAGKKPLVSYEQACRDHEDRMRATGAEVRLFYRGGKAGSIARTLEMREFWIGVLVAMIVGGAAWWLWETQRGKE